MAFVSCRQRLMFLTCCVVMNGFPAREGLCNLLFHHCIQQSTPLERYVRTSSFFRHSALYINIKQQCSACRVNFSSEPLGRHFPWLCTRTTPIQDVSRVLSHIAPEWKWQSWRKIHRRVMFRIVLCMRSDVPSESWILASLTCLAITVSLKNRSTL